MPLDFPAAEYESIVHRVQLHSPRLGHLYEHFGGAWNAISYRFLAATENETAFTQSIARFGGGLDPSERHRQESHLFAFFANGFAAFESCFYGLFSLGAHLSPPHFPMNTARDHQSISPSSTKAAISKAFSSDPINGVLQVVTGDPAYIEWREIRNILTHRTAPGRTVFVGIGDDNLPDQWKINQIPLDVTMAPQRRANLSRLLEMLLQGIDEFVRLRF